ncbi:MAG: DNA polymerase IV [Anaeroplasma sp.]|nr:DNA polymerase IV [Anaeroplasma sp.]
MIKKENHVRIIFHIDMNAYFCSVACILYPSLRGEAFAIGRENTYKGVISTASYEARALGIHAAMPISEAYKIKPDLKVISIDYRYYQDYHNKFVNIIKEYSNLIEVASIDELYADMTDISKSKHPIVLAKEIQLRLLKELGLSCSIGIAPTLFLAKMASDIKKPLGITVIRKKDVKDILYPLSVKEIFGIGKKTYPKLINGGINTIAEFMMPENKDRIISIIGDNSYNYVINHILGNSSNIIDPNRYSDSSSISTSQTYDVFLSSLSEILYEMRRMTRELCSKMKSKDYYTKTVNITLRDDNFHTITRQDTLDEYSNDFQSLYEVITNLVEDNYSFEKRYRLVGVGFSNILHESELPIEYNLFTINDKDVKAENINNIISMFQQKYGKNIIYRKKDKND